MLICPFYSLVQGIALADYWHNHDECAIAKTIPLATRLPGKDSRPHCPYCALLDETKTARRGPKEQP